MMSQSLSLLVNRRLKHKQYTTGGGFRCCFKMKFNLINGRCIEFKTRVQSLEREITAAIQFIKSIENQYWDVLKNSHNNEDSHLLDALQKMGEKLAHYFNQEKDQIWIAESVAKISTILR